MAKEKTVYICTVCGKEYPKWVGKCNECDSWNTIEEKIKSPLNFANKILDSNQHGRKLKDVSLSADQRIKTGIEEFDRVLGGGIVADSFNLLSAPPGCGKSTLSLMVADKLAGMGINVLYASGEESASQIKNRANRLKLQNADDIFISDTSNLDFVLEEIEKCGIQFFVLDSIQTFYLNELLPSKQGNPAQCAGVVNAIKDVCKQSGNPRCCIAISQMNKKEEIAGYNSIPHIVDSCLYLEGDDTDPIRILRAEKNRFGDTEEAGFFYMRETGLEEVSDLANYFITKRDHDVVGVAVTGVREANRYAMCEIESLTPMSCTSFPTRISGNLKKDNLNTLVSILEQRADMNFGTKNVIIKTSGNVSIRDSSNNLAILASISSSYYKKPIPQGTAFYGDVSLTGEIKKSPNFDSFIRECDRLGYHSVYVAKDCVPTKAPKNVTVVYCENISDVLNKLFGISRKDV